MKKPFYLIHALILCCFGTLYAQQSSRIIAESTYGLQSGNFKFADSSNYTYSFGRGGHPDTTILFDKQTYYYNYNYYTTGVSPVKTYQHTMAYDNKGFITEYTLSEWDTQANAWSNMTLIHYTVSPTGAKINDTSWTWDAVSNKWNINDLVYYETNTEGKITTYHGLRINPSTQKLDSTSRYTIKYNAAGNIDEEIYIIFVSGKPENYLKHTYSYNAAGIRTDFITYRWDNVNNKWVEQSKNVNTVTGIQITQTIGFNWDVNTSQWVNTFRNSMTYDGSGNQTKMVGERYLANTSSWANSSEYIYTYNTFKQKTQADISSWDVTNKKWVLQSIKTYYYETYTTSSITNINTQNNELKLWPVPCNEILNIHIEWDNTQEYTALITDATGRIYKQWNKPTASSTEQVDISHLPTGNYILLLQSNKGATEQKMFNVLR